MGSCLSEGDLGQRSGASFEGASNGHTHAPDISSASWRHSSFQDLNVRPGEHEVPEPPMPPGGFWPSMGGLAQYLCPSRPLSRPLLGSLTRMSGSIGHPHRGSERSYGTAYGTIDGCVAAFSLTLKSSR